MPTRTTTTTTTRSSRFLGTALVLLLSALALLPALGQTRETASHEGLYGVLSQEVAAGRGFFAPRVGGRPYAEKPPAFFWAAALAGKARGHVDLVAARLPSVVALAASALLVLALGRKLGGDRRGLVAAVALLATPLAVHAGRVARLDASLTALVLLAELLALSARDAPRARGQALSAFAGVALGMAVLVKGPVALALFAFFVLAVPCKLRWAAFVAGLAIPLSLFVLGVLREAPGQLELLIFQHDLTSGVEEHDRPFYHYLGILPAGLGAMLPFALVACVEAVKAARERGLRAVDPALAVAAATFVLLSFIPGKRAHYLVPVYPFVALSVGALLERPSTRLVALWARAAPFALAAVGLGVTGYVGVAGGAWCAVLVVASAGLLAAGVVASRWTDERRLTLALAGSVFATSLGIAAYHDRGVELVFPENGAVSLGAAIRGFPDSVPLILADADPEAIFFADRPFDDVRGPHASSDLVAWGAKHADGLFLIGLTQRKDLPWETVELARGSVRKHDLVLVRRRR